MVPVAPVEDVDVTDAAYGEPFTTRLKTEATLTFGDKKIAPGEYSLFIDLKPTQWTLIVSTWAMDGAALDPQLAVFDAAGKRMETEILVHQDGSTTIQLRNVKAETVYFVRVTSIDAHEAR